MITLSKGQTALLQSYINQVDTQVTRANYSAPYISDTNYNNLVDAIEVWVEESNTGELIGTAENGGTFTFDGIDQFPISKR